MIDLIKNREPPAKELRRLRMRLYHKYMSTLLANPVRVPLFGWLGMKGPWATCQRTARKRTIKGSFQHDRDGRALMGVHGELSPGQGVRLSHSQSPQLT